MGTLVEIANVVAESLVAFVAAGGDILTRPFVDDETWKDLAFRRKVEFLGVSQGWIIVPVSLGGAIAAHKIGDSSSVWAGAILAAAVWTVFLLWLVSLGRAGYQCLPGFVRWLLKLGPALLLVITHLW